MKDSEKYIENREEIVREVFELTSLEQQKRILEECLSMWSKQDIEALLAIHAPEIFEFEHLARGGLTPSKILENTILAQHKAMLRVCLWGLTRPEFKRLLYLFAKEIINFSRLIEDLGGRKVVPCAMNG